jgi:hypothetical protein
MIFASTVSSGHLAFVIKLAIAERGQSVPTYSAATLDDAQRREKIEIETKREHIQAMMKEQTPEQVDAPEELPPNQPATVTVAQPANAQVVVGQTLPAAAQQIDGAVGGSGEVQPLPVDAKAAGIEDGSLTIEVKVGVPLRGGSQLDDEALFDPLHYTGSATSLLMWAASLSRWVLISCRHQKCGRTPSSTRLMRSR